MNKNICSVCDTYEGTKLVCNHNLCDRCFFQLRNIVCPVCKNKLTTKDVKMEYLSDIINKLQEDISSFKTRNDTLNTLYQKYNVARIVNEHLSTNELILLLEKQELIANIMKRYKIKDSFELQGLPNESLKTILE